MAFSADSNYVLLGDNLDVLRKIPDESVDLVYMDPPFNTGNPQTRKDVKTLQDEAAERALHASVIEKMGKSYSYEDNFGDLFYPFIRLRLTEVQRVLKPTGSALVHLDWREAAYIRVLGDSIFGRENFFNEIIWAYDYGGRSKRRFPRKHDNILAWAKDEKQRFFEICDEDRIPYKSGKGGLVSDEKLKKGKRRTDVIWHTIVPTNSHEKTGYPTQKPIGLLEILIRALSPKDGLVLDPFAGSGTTGEAAIRNDRRFILVDENLQALEVMRDRFKPYLLSGKSIKFKNMTVHASIGAK
tara:strand:+ start:221668 stop:222561 length:894 start_codon:yes stop_codon:yes gene_type:complete